MEATTVTETHTHAHVAPIAYLEITCGECLFMIPFFARKTGLRKPDLRTDTCTCPTCGASYQIGVYRTKSATLATAQLEVVRNKNR